MAARILIVEDDPDIAELVGRYLDKAGFTTERVASGREALSRLGSRPPDLLVLDLMLPHVDGLEICRLVRASDKTAAIPIIMLTARAEESSWAPTITWRSRSVQANWSHACARCSGARSAAVRRPGR